MNNLADFWNSIKSILYQLPKIEPSDVIEIILIAVVIYQLIKWLRGTRAWSLFKGLVVLFAIYIFAMMFNLSTILWLFANTLSVGIIAVIIVFQPELRRALEQLGRRNIFKSISFLDDHSSLTDRITSESIYEIIQATEDMSKVKTGALIVLEQSVILDEYERTGIPVDGIISTQMLLNIFEHNTPLHDGSIIIRDNRILAATCYLPLSDNMSLSKSLGTRHRAAVGITEVSDAMVIIVSEETGFISMAIGGNLIRNVDSDYLKNKLLYAQKKNEDVKKFKIWKGRKKNAQKNN
jgi:diadenylate cyclase